MTIDLLAMTNRELASVRVPDAIAPSTKRKKVGGEAAICPRIRLLRGRLRARRSREVGWRCGVADVTMDKSDSSDALEHVLVPEESIGVAIHGVTASEKAMTAFADMLALDGMDQNVRFFGTLMRG